MKKWISLLLMVAMLTLYYGAALANTIKLPGQLKQIEDEAFYGDKSLDEVDIPSGTTAIGCRAFAQSGVRRIYIPDTVSVIADDAFDGASEVTIVSSSRSYAKSYAKEKSIRWEDSESPVDLNELYDFLDDDSINSIQEDFVYFSDDTGYVEQLKGAVEEYDAAVKELVGSFNDLASVFSTSAIEVQGSNVSFSIGDFEYSLSGTVSAGEYEIVSTEVVGNSVQTEILLNGATKYIIMNQSGTRISDTPTFTDSMPLRARSTNSFLDTVEKVFEVIRDWNGRIMSVVGQINTGIEAAVRKAESVYEAAKQERWIAFSAGHLAEQAEKAQRNLDAATRQLNKVNWFRDIWRKWVLGSGRNLGIAGSTSAIAADITRYFSKIRPLYSHGHPTKLEAEDTYAKYLADMLDRSCRSATLALITDAASNSMSIILECSGICSRIVGAVPQLLPVSFTLGLGAQALKTALDLVVNTWGTVNSCMADSYIRTAESTDAKLHTIVCGYVTDSETEKPLENVGVTNGEMAAVTSKSGYYKVYLDPGKQTLLFNLKGYKKKDVDVIAVKNKQVQKDVELQPKTIILTREDLEAVAEDPDDDYMLGADIDLSDAPWTPLPVLRGSLDGAGHTISGMYITGDYENVDVGLFSEVSGTIEALNLTGMRIDIHGTGNFCNVFPLGCPADVWSESCDTNTYLYKDCTVSGTVNLNTDDGCWSAFSALSRACNSTARVNCIHTGVNYSDRVLWRCSRCTFTGNVTARPAAAPQGSIDIIRDCVNCTGNSSVLVNPSDHPKGVMAVSGIYSEYIQSRGNTFQGSIYHEGYTNGIWGGNKGADDCEVVANLTSDNLNGLYHCTHSRLDGVLKTIGGSSDVYCNILEDFEGDATADNIIDSNYAYEEDSKRLPANIFINAWSGRDTTINTPIIIEGLSLTNVQIGLYSRLHTDGRSEGDELDEMLRNGDIRVKTGSGFISIYSELSTAHNTYAESETGIVTVMAGSYNTGNVTGISGRNTVQVTGGSKYNAGAVLVQTSSAKGTSYGTGVYGDHGFNMGTITGINRGTGTINITGVNGSNAWNEGKVTTDQYGRGLAYAAGIYGANGVNKGEIICTGHGGTSDYVDGSMGWNVCAIGVNGSNGWNDAPISASNDGSAHVLALGAEDGVNLGKIDSKAGQGYSNAIGIRTGTYNGGEITTTTNGHVARAWGAQYTGANSAKVSATMPGAIDQDAYADAQGGTAYAKGGKAYTSGRSCTAVSLYAGKTVTNGYGWLLGSHNHDNNVTCGASYWIVTKEPYLDVPNHSYNIFAKAVVTNDARGSAPKAPEKPTVKLPF